MKIALLGLGTVGKAVFDIINNKKGLLFEINKIDIKYILIRNINRYDVDKSLLTTSLEKIIKDKEIEVVFEAMGAGISYQYIKEVLLSGKSVITANKEVIANHIDELEYIAFVKKVNLLYEAAVGGGIPIINALKSAALVNTITKISGILNGTTNYILTKMQKDKVNFNNALQAAQKAGFAEADPTADLQGLDMVRKIAILSRIAFHSKIKIEDIYHYGIENIDKNIIDVADILNYKLKFMATSSLKNNEISIYVEPVLVSKNDLLANVDYENNVIEYYGDNCGKQIMIGKGAGYITANAMVNDLNLYFIKKVIIPSNYQDLKINNENNDNNSYLLRLNNPIDIKFIYRNLKDFIITKEISRKELFNLLPFISFYARIKK